MIKKLTKIIILFSLILTPFSVSAAPSFLEILSPWDSFRSYLGSNQGGIPQAAVSAHQEFLAWYSMFSPDHWVAEWNLKNGNQCEQLKITHLQNLTKNYLAALRDIEIGWIEGTTDSSRASNIISFLKTFLTAEFAKINQPQKNFSLFGKDFDCSQPAVCDSDSTGEFCTSDPSLFILGSEALGELHSLFCSADGSKTPDINESNWQDWQSITSSYLKKVIEFYQKAQATVAPIYTININYNFNQKATLEKSKISQATWEACAKKATGNIETTCGLEPVSAQSCLASPDYPKFLNVNYRGNCGCPSLAVSWTDLRGIFDELLESLKDLEGLNKLMAEVYDMVTNSKDKTGKTWWEKFDDSAQMEARKEFKKLFGYDPPSETSSRQVSETTEGFFKRFFNPLNRLKAAITLTNQSISPVMSLGQVLNKLTSNGAAAPIAQVMLTQQKSADRNAQAKELAALDIKTINLVTFANSALDIAYGISSAGSTLRSASCREILRQTSLNQVFSMLNLPDNQNSMQHYLLNDPQADASNWNDPSFGANLLKGANSTMRVLDAFFGGRDQENDACKLLRQMQSKLNVKNPSQ